MGQEEPLSVTPDAPVRGFTNQVSINAPLERVWSIVTDVDRMPGVHPKMLSARWLDGASEAALGVRFTSEHVHEEYGVWTAVSRIVDFQHNRSIAWTIEGAVTPPTVCRFDLIDAPNPESSQSQTWLRQTYFYDTRPGASPPIEQALGFDQQTWRHG